VIVAVVGEAVDDEEATEVDEEVDVEPGLALYAKEELAENVAQLAVTV